MKLKMLIGLIFTIGMVVGCSSSGTDSNMGATTGTQPVANTESFGAGPFTVEPGDELIMCSYVRSERADEQDITRFDSTQTVGGHHLIVYTVSHPVDLAPAKCSQGGQPGWSQVLATGLESETMTFPTGVGYHVKPHQQYVLESHFINTTGHALEVKNGFTAHYAAPGTVTQRASTYYIGTGNIDISPASAAEKAVTCKLPVPIDLHTMFGHIHRFGTNVTVDLLPGGGGASKPLYSTTEWENPPISTLAGGLTLGADDSVKVTCDWDNTSAKRLGYPAEMCFSIGYYWPAQASLMCASGGGSDTCQCWYPDSVDTGPGGSTVEITLGRAATIAGALKGDIAAGDPVYCSLFRAEDWEGAAPKPGAQPVYYRSRVDVPLPTAASTAVFTIDDVTPGDYVGSCYADTAHGGFVAGSGDAVNSMPVPVSAVAGTTVKVAATLDFALP